MNTNTQNTRLAATLTVLLFSLFTAFNSNAATIKITNSINWSAITGGSGPGGAPNASDDIEISQNGTYITINTTAVCRSMRIGKGTPHIMGLIFTGSNTLTVNGVITADFGPSQGTRGAVIDFGTNNASGILTCQGFTGVIIADTTYLTPGSGTIKLTATNSLPRTMKNFHSLILDGATTLTTDINVTGNFQHNTAFVPNGKTVTFNGANSQTISGLASPAFYNLIVNKTGGSVTLSKSISVNNALTLAASNIVLGNNNLTMVSGSAISGGSATSYIQADGTGRLLAVAASGSTKNFPIGSATGYLPVGINVPSSSSSTEFAAGVEDGVLNSSDIAITSDVVKATWNVTPSSSVNGVVVSFGWKSSYNGTGYSPVRSFIVKRNALSTDWSPVDPSSLPLGTNISSSANSVSDYVQSTPTLNLNTNNGLYAVGDDNADFQTNVPLPVEFISFTATKQANTAMLNFATAWEINNAGFEVERSTNGISWSKIGFVLGKGNSTEVNNYSFATSLVNINAPVVYYRLKQVDFNGQFEYSVVRTIRLSATAAKTTSVYPNPATSKIAVSLEGIAAGEMAKISVMDMSGKILISANQIVEEGNYTLDMNIDNLTKGNYIVNISSPSANYNTKLVKF